MPLAPSGLSKCLQVTCVSDEFLYTAFSWMKANARHSPLDWLVLGNQSITDGQVLIPDQRPIPYEAYGCILTDICSREVCWASAILIPIRRLYELTKEPLVPVGYLTLRRFYCLLVQRLGVESTKPISYFGLDSRIVWKPTEELWIPVKSRWRGDGE